MKNLSDLDEAILRCYNKNTAEYLREAITCYRSGAYRSAIVTTWNCIFFDIMEKVRELSLSGDTVATRHLLDFESAVDRNDVNKLLAIEREVLDVARSDLEFFNEIEYTDLKRIYEDRNRCAHPTVNASGDIFHPSPDLARSHIVHAIDHLLSFPPSHGKNALNRLLDDVKSPLFPTSVPKALEVLQHSPVVRARRSVLRNFLVVLLKTVARESDYKFVARASAAIKAYGKINHQFYLEIFQDEVSKIIRGLADGELDGAIKILSLDALAWEGLALDQRRRLEGFYENLEGLNLDYVSMTYEIPELEAAAQRCVNRLSVGKIRENLWFGLPRIIINRLMDLYRESHSFDNANLIAKTFIENVSDLAESDAINIAKCGEENGQVSGSFDFSRLIKTLQARFPESKELRDIVGE